MADPHGLFRKHERVNPADAVQDQKIGEETRRLRTLEERYTNLERRLQVTEQNMLSSDRKIHLDLKAANAELRDARNELADLQEKMHAVIDALRHTARQDELDVLKKELSFWQPVNFVTRRQVESLVRDLLEEDEQKV